MVIGVKLRQRYQISRVLGSGAFGDTYLAEDLDLPNHPQCVVKHLQIKPPNTAAALPIARRLFAQEAETLQKLGSHDQIPQLFAYFEENNEFYLVQEFVKGKDLSQEVYPQNQLPEYQVKKLLIEILEVLTFVHQQNIIHRDLKPQNIMRRSGDGKIMLIDFGAVKETMTVNSQGQTILTVAIGTPGYMPSEQTAGSPKLASDVYAVGMLGIYALTGIQPHQLPKDPTTEEVIWRNWANVSEDFAKILIKMVRYHFSERYSNAGQALKALTPAPAPPPPPPPPPPPAKTDRRHFLQLASVAVGSFGLAVVGNKLFSGSGEQTTPISQTSSPTSSPEPSPQVSQTSVSSTSNNSNLKTFNFEVVKTDSTGSIISRSNSSANYFTEDLGNGVTLEMVEIPGGTFLMGSPESEAQRDSDESPQRQVTVPSFFMGKYQLTQKQYQAIIGNNPSNFKGDNRPVERVSWNDAVRFCEQLSQRTGKNYTLPSEAEWEYACRAGTTTPFYFGESITPDLVNYDGNATYGSAPKGEYRQQTTDVGSFPPNAFGLYDMHGNVWEWCWDDWVDNYNNAPIDGSAATIKSGSKLLRGGSWYNYPRDCRSAYRDDYNPDYRNVNYGFRLVVSGARTL
ncbi:bifunctional serine/threonine-protein kinase/formylglycine-generating enzyme family protein [Sphaerospermopsis torques-reginae]|uniref:SUMF1/EgtB/PvdO family nonheme iron enzyme n=1 Tax=Sphaerospermopsis torques-reginae ITEP-024 TaxID=984208 RepID=A0ABX8WWZ3_9CYAN|nr:bifunctional serine/threonine-protein kinase/formylglycine-generating enzyme family protein [Sphaerospermopsis torques-reginae]QYX30892.1 SUMF1/EgtB/PvdO family nonheme iron enzyme [Sphaerospermopsis torques-reginae ITEP-024]